MQAHITSWNILIGIIAVAIILLSVLLVYYYRKLKTLRTQLAKNQELLQEQLNKQTKLSSELTDLQTDFNQSVLVDPITQLPSFRVFEDRLRQTIHQSERHQLIFAVLYMDIDELKVINNVMGDEAINILLKEVVNRLLPCIRKVDTMSYVTINGFAFILSRLSKPGTAAYVAQRLIDVVSQPFKVKERELFITASIGITIYPTDGTKTKQLLKNADIALHQAKSRGCNMYQFYHEDLYAVSHRELILSSGLRGESIFKELVLYYQPIINVVTKEIISMEALLRWHHPELGVVPPGDFLRLAENNGTIVAIGEGVLRSACMQFKKWQEQGFYLRHISVNVSLRQLENVNFTYKVSQLLQELKLEPHNLMLEVSESVLLPKLNLVEKTLHMLKHLDVRVAVDDFGTGYLSLQHLQRFPMSCLKIDNTLIQQMMLETNSETVVKTIINLAKSLQLEIVGEGVETEKQKDLLLEMGCPIMQGYLFCRPLLPEEFTQPLLQAIANQV